MEATVTRHTPTTAHLHDECDGTKITLIDIMSAVYVIVCNLKYYHN